MEHIPHTLEELEQKISALKEENKMLNMRKMDLALYQKAYEKHVIERRRNDLTYGKLCNHPDYYTTWRGTFFDTNIRLIESGIFMRYPSEELGKSIEARRQERHEEEPSWPFPELIPDEWIKKDRSHSAHISSCESYERALNGICTFESLKFDLDNPNKEPVYLDVDQVFHPILGYCDSIKANNGKYQLHLTDPYGECLFPPFDITKEEAELALGRICVINCAYNHYATEPKLLELQILPYTLKEKLGDYETDTVIIERNPEIKFKPFAFL